MTSPTSIPLSSELDAREAGFDSYFDGLEKCLDEKVISIPRQFADAFIDGWALGHAYHVAIFRRND